MYFVEVMMFGGLRRPGRASRQLGWGHKPEEAERAAPAGQLVTSARLATMHGPPARSARPCPPCTALP
ncbi:unnamed protein product [Boreogadus saida]